MKESDIMYTDNKKNGRLAAVLLIAVFFACVALPVGAQDAALPDFTIADDTLSVEADQAPAVDSAAFAYQPEWYVAPVIPAAKRAPKRATMAADCPTDSVQTYNVDSVLVEVASYDYDDAGNVIRSIKWACEPDGKRVGTFKEEYGFDANGTQVMTAVYAWDNTANDWRGTEKSEFVYDNEERIVSNTEYTWLNNAWVPQTKYTYTYDSEGREAEFYTYTRDANTNQLVYSKAHIQNWNEAGKKILDIQYTAYSNGDWSAGTKKEWVFDALGNQTEYVYYASIANHNWVGSARELWEYNAAGKKTLYIKYSWANSAWVGVSKEEWQYVGSTLMLNAKYVWSNGAWVGSSKETWTYASANMKHNTFIWLNSDWANVEQEEWEYTSGKQTLYIKSSWTDNAWLGVSKEVWAYTSGKQTLHETYTGVNNAWVITDREVWAYASDKQILHEKYTTDNDALIGVEKDEWEYSGNQVTRHAKYAWYNNDWTTLSCEEYDASGNQTLVETYSISSSNVLAGTKKEEYAFSAAGKTILKKVYKWNKSKKLWGSYVVTGYDDAGNTTESCGYSWSNNAWIGSGERILTTYNTAKKKTDEITQVWATSDWVNSFRQTYTYIGGIIMQEASFNWKNNEWSDSRRTDYHYNAAGRNDSINVYKKNGTVWEYNQRTVNTFDAVGNKILSHVAQYKNGKWVLKSMEKLDILFDDANRQILYASWTCGPDSVWKGVEKDTTKYSSTDNVLFHAVYKGWANNKWVGSLMVEYAYDANDRLILEKRMDWDASANAWRGNYESEYGYDEQGRKNMTASYDQWDKTLGGWADGSKEEMVYDEQNRKIVSVMSVWTGVKWRQVFRYSYAFDNSNHEVEKTVEHYENGGWVYTDKYEKEYIGSTLIKNNSYMLLNGEWVLSSQYEQTFDNDAQAKLRRKIEGSWNNGEMLSYSDERYFYSCDDHYFIVRFVNYDGSLLVSSDVLQGDMPVYTGDTPVKPADAQYTYTFAGWDKAIVPADGHTTYVATFSSTKNKYTITWLNEDGSQIDQTMVEYGAIPTHADPTKANTAEYTYTFAGWDKTPVAVTGEATYKATFNSAKNKYLITFQNEDGSVIEAKEYEYGATPVAPADPTKQATAQYTYTFSGWDNTIVAVTGEATYKATFTSTLNKYLITFQNEDGSVIEAKEYEYGATPIAPADPTKDATAQYTYTFSGWDNTIVAVTGEATYKATFEATINSYIITWVDEDGVTVLYEAEFAYGSMPEYGGADPVKEATAEYTYSFAGWTPEVVEVVGTATYTATYTATLFTGVDNAANNQAAVKVVENGIVYIVRAGKKYAITGVAVE